MFIAPLVMVSKMCLGYFSLQHQQQCHCSPVGERGYRHLLYPQGATKNSGLGLKKPSLETEISGHLVSVIQAELVFWDNLNEKQKKDKIFLGTL